MKLNIGCGNDYRKGYINIDNSELVKPDYIVNLEECKLPFQSNTFDEIICNHVLEHINNFIPLVKEMHRVSQKGSKILIRCPFYAAWGQYNDPTHVRFFSLYTFDYFNPSSYSHECGIHEAGEPMFNIKVKLNYGVGKMKKFNWIMNQIINLYKDFYVRFLAFIIPCVEIRYELEVLK